MSSNEFICPMWTHLRHSINVALLSVIALVSTMHSAPAQAAGDLAYYGFEPDIVTNYIRKGSDLGYIRLTAEIMVDGNSNLEIIEHHAPLLRAAVVEIFGRQAEEKVKSIAGREEIRRQCLQAINDLLEQETGRPLAADLLFTKYLYH